MVLNRTKTIKERLVYVYLPSEEMVAKWKKQAKAARTSLSKFVIEHVESGIRQEDDDFVPRLKLLKKITDLGEKNDLLRQEKQRLGIVVDKLQEDLQVYRMQPFLDNRFEGVRMYERGLIDVFKKKGFIKTDELWREIDVNPRDETTVKAVTRQLENLEQYGLIKKTFEGWRWKN
jgi:hypothetical protein